MYVMPLKIFIKEMSFNFSHIYKFKTRITLTQYATLAEAYYKLFHMTAKYHDYVGMNG